MPNDPPAAPAATRSTSSQMSRKVDPAFLRKQRERENQPPRRAATATTRRVASRLASPSASPVKPKSAASGSARPAMYVTADVCSG